MFSILGLVSEHVKQPDVLGRDAFHTATFPQMEPLMVRGTRKNLFTCSGNNGIVKVIAVTIVWLTERKREMHLVIDLLNIMANGPSSVYMGYRFAVYQIYTSLKTYFWTFFTNLLQF